MILRHLVFEKILKVETLLFLVVVDNMAADFHFAFELVGNFVYSLGFVIEIYYMRLGDALFAFVRFVYIVRKYLVDRMDLVDRCSTFCDDDLC